MKTKSLIVLASLSLLLLPSCRHPSHPRSVWSPGGRAVLPIERHPRSPASPGGVAVLPREAKRVVHRGVVYYHCRGVWYRPHGARYVVVKAPC